MFFTSYNAGYYIIPYLHIFADWVCRKFTQDSQWQDSKGGTQTEGMVHAYLENLITLSSIFNNSMEFQWFSN